MDEIRAATPGDWPGIWEIFHHVVKNGDTYPYAPDTTEGEAKTLWLDIPQATYVGIQDGRVAGTYYLKPNQPELGAHVCNAGYMVHPDLRRRGAGRTLCVHSLKEARRLGFLAMQYNLVVASNEKAIRLWKDLGFETIGFLPRAFRHSTEGLIDALVMYRSLEEEIR
ncbi:MAG: GNAT family N-acetyltransferase [Alphaproteobacteria bacterium]|jgi:L-amino acid N-acyltransferase YncA|nr:GNAT family N-acetyltransferase [Alphaproteobacteria bacterium]MBT7941813.1 GNAT family N-acetyltransferase [Alphaproteobacteria bacterium]